MPRTVAAALVISIVVQASASASAAHGRSSEPPAVPATAAEGTQPNPFRIGRPLVIPHAGGDALFPENTIYAYEQAMAMGGDVVDIDVWIAGDGVPVAIHDPTVDRTTDGTGSVASLSSAQLATLDAAYDFGADDGFPLRGTGIGIPTVEQILLRFPTSLVTLDMKDQRDSSAAPVCALLRRLGRITGIYVGSDTNEQIAEFRRQCPEIPTSGTREERQASRAAREAGDRTFRSGQLVSQPRLVGTDGIRRVTAETLAFSHQSNTAVLTWVVDDVATMHELIDLGVDGIYTRRPDLLVEVLRQRGLRP